MSDATVHQCSCTHPDSRGACCLERENPCSRWRIGGWSWPFILVPPSTYSISPSSLEDGCLYGQTVVSCDDGVVYAGAGVSMVAQPQSLTCQRGGGFSLAGQHMPLESGHRRFQAEPAKILVRTQRIEDTSGVKRLGEVSPVRGSHLGIVPAAAFLLRKHFRKFEKLRII